MTMTFKINSTSGSNGFMCPPGHWNHTHSLEGYPTPRSRTVDMIASLDAVDEPGTDAPQHIIDAVNRIRSNATLVCSESWIRNVYGYFRNMYVPESGSRKAADLISHNPAGIAAAQVRPVMEEKHKTAEDNRFRRVVNGRRRGYEVTAKADGTKVYVYALADDGTRYGALPILEEYADALRDAGFTDVHIQDPQATPTAFVPERVAATVTDAPEAMDPERHAAVALIRQYFPDHTPRVDLIENPGKGYGMYPCTKCGEKVQYEAKFDAHVTVSTHGTYGTDCPQGGAHTIES
ncbi:hypothetical protein ACFQ6C_26665 [Streptomyces sp. NPDC056454]|uniref:hypothetical protein n=1 Tax=Streptomyces sp. NPDC056454 TaxID=3345823 RepID=UPI0036C3D747